MSVAESVVRLVEASVGQLGRVRPATDDETTGENGRQTSIVRLAARIYAGRMQRLGDRIYLDGEEIEIPLLVRKARSAGLRIRYPGLDPMERTYIGGPSVRKPPKRTASALPAFLSGNIAGGE